MDLRYYTSVLVDQPGKTLPRRYDGVVSLEHPERHRDVAEVVGDAVGRALGVPREQIRVVQCARMH
jgi:hypothetical protein